MDNGRFLPTPQFRRAAVTISTSTPRKCNTFASHSKPN
jgi:hypothetical protein